jgi:GAF domain-containing protein
VEVKEAYALDEPAWRLFSEATAAVGIRSTLTLPILVRDRVTGSVNLYASSARAFTGHHQQLADALGAWAPGAVTNSDLSFNTREAAQRTPLVLRERVVVDTAVGHLMATQGLTVDESC